MHLPKETKIRGIRVNSADPWQNAYAKFWGSFNGVLQWGPAACLRHRDMEPYIQGYPSQILCCIQDHDLLSAFGHGPYGVSGLL